MELKDRKDIDEKYKFDLTKFCKTSDEFYMRLKLVQAKAQKLADYKGKLGNPEKLLEFYKLDEEISLELDDLDSYAHLNLDVDLQNTEFQQMQASLENVGVEISSLQSFSGEEIKNLGKEYLEKLIGDPRFADYKISHLDTLRGLDHILSEHDDYLTTQMSEFASFVNTHSVLVNSEIEFEKPLDSKGVAHDLTWSTYYSIMKDDDRTLRENAYHSICKGMKRFKSSVFSLILNEYKSDDFMNKLAKFDGVLEAQMMGYNVPIDVFEKIIAEASKHAEATKIYKSAKSKILGLEKLEPWDGAVPIVKEEKEYTFEVAVQTMQDCLAPLGEVYLNSLKQCVEERWCDVYPCKDKTSGIYTSNSYSHTPILHLNWANKMEDVFIFVHEFGHAVQSLVTSKAQPYATSGLPWIMIEVPSLMCETLMFQHLLDTAKSDNEKLLAMQNFIRSFEGNVFGGCAQADFERYLRESVRDRRILDVESASDKYLDIIEELRGERPREEGKYNWMSDIHYFYPYYNYVYSLCMIVAVYFAKGIYNGNEKIKNDFFKFMQTGTSEYILDNLNACGVDLLGDKVYDEAFDFYKDAADKFSELADKKCAKNNIVENDKNKQNEK